MRERPDEPRKLAGNNELLPLPLQASGYQDNVARTKPPITLLSTTSLPERSKRRSSTGSLDPD